MKFNKWTLGLAAVGAVSLASVAQAEEKANPLLTAVSSTTLSGYVDTSIHWNPGSGNGNQPAYAFNTPAKADGFNLDSVLVRLSKPLDETEWAAGYDVDLFFGPDANSLGTSPIGGIAGTDFAIKQAYVALRTPIAGTTGIDWKLGVFDNWIGYESTETPNNPNYTRSYGYSLEPTTFTGLMGTYKFTDMLSASAGIANTMGPIIGGTSVGGGPVPSVSFGRANPPKAESYKAYMGSVAFTAPNDWGSFGGSSFYAGVVNGWGGGAATSGVTTELYLGATLNTPVAGLKAGVSYDNLGIKGETYNGGTAGAVTIDQAWANDVALYASYQLTEKMSVHGRGEYLWQSTTDGAGGGPITGPNKVFALTGTLQYDLWKNVISRLEVRWDHQAGSMGTANGGANPNAYAGGLTPIPGGGGINAGISPAPAGHNMYLVAANIIYKF